MQRWQRTLLWAATVTVVLLAIAAAGASMLLDGEQLTQMAKQRVQQSLQRELHVDGLRLHLFPVPTLRADRVTLANPEWASQPDMLQAEKLSARIRLLPLLSGELALRSLAADTVRLDLETDRDGQRNWIFAERDPAMPQAMQFSGLDVRQLQLTWRTPQSSPKSSPPHWTLHDLHVTAGPGWTRLALSAGVMRNQQRLELAARVADISDAGQPGASSDGEISVHGEDLSLRLHGKLPLNTALDGYAVELLLKAGSLRQAQQFFDWGGAPAEAPVALTAQLRREGTQHIISDLKLALGRQQASGSGIVVLDDGRLDLRASVASEQLHWRQLRRDLGLASAPPRPADALLPAHPLPWQGLAALQAIDATIDTRIGTVVVGGLALQQWRSTVRIGQKNLALDNTQFQLLGGQASGTLQLEPARRQVRMKLNARKLMLQDLLKDSSRAGMLEDGPLDLSAAVTARGGSWKELAASIDGPVGISIGATQLQSRKAQEAEAMLIGLWPALTAKDAAELRLHCVNLWLPFSNGRAASGSAVGLRSDASKLLLSGVVDLRKQSLDLRGRVRAASGVALGMAAIAGDVQIAGPLQQPDVSINPPGALARLGAAIATSGLSIIATAVYDAATSDDDPCATVASAHAAATKTAAPPAPKAASVSRRAEPRSADTR